MVAIVPRILRIYATPDGHTPFSEWLDSLQDWRGQALITTRLDRLRLGNFGDCQPIGEGLSELRIDFGPGYRVYFGQETMEIVLLLCGGSKRSQRRDVEKAKRYWRDYKGRRNA